MKSLTLLFKADLEGRNLTADLIKGIAVVLMFAVHLSELIAESSFYTSQAVTQTLFVLRPRGAPLFMAVMGYFIGGRKRPLSTGIKRGLALILSGILLNISLNASLLYKIVAGESFLNPWHFILGADILPLAGLSVMVIALFRHYAKDNLWLGAAVLMLVVLINELLPRGVQYESEVFRYFMVFIFSNDYWSYFPLFPWLVYPFAGYLFRIAEPRLQISPLMIKLLPFLLPLLFLAGAGLVYNDIAQLKLWYHHRWNVVIWNFLFFAGYIPLIHLIAAFFKENGLLLWISWLGKYVTVAYVVQWIIIGNAGTYFYKSVPAEWLVLWFAGVSLAVTGFIFVYKIFRNRKAGTKKDSART